MAPGTVNPLEVEELLLTVLGFCTEYDLLFVVPSVCRKWRDVCRMVVCPTVHLHWLSVAAAGANADKAWSLLQPILSRVKTARSIDLGGQLHSIAFVLADLFAVFASPATTSLCLGDHVLAANGLASIEAGDVLPKFPNLRDVQLPVNRFSKVLANLHSLARLEWLCLIDDESRHPSVADIDFAPAIEGMHRLKTIILKGFATITGSFCKSVPLSVTRISLRQCGIVDLSGMRDRPMQRVEVVGQEVTPAFVVHVLTKFHKTKTISLKNTFFQGPQLDLPPQDAEPIFDDPPRVRSSLQHLKIANSLWGDPGVDMMRYIVGMCPNLRTINMGNTRLAPAEFRSLCGAAQLEELDIHGVKISSDVFHDIRRLTKLRVLICDGAPPVSPTPDPPPAVWPMCIMSLTHLPSSLVELDLSHTHWLSAQHFWIIGKLVNVTELNLEGCRGVNDVALSRICRKLKSIASLNIAWCSTTEACLGESIRLMRQLRHLCIGRKVVGEGEGFRELRENNITRVIVRTRAAMEAKRLNVLIGQPSLRVLQFEMPALMGRSGPMNKAEAQAYFSKGGRISIVLKRRNWFFDGGLGGFRE